MIGTGTIVNVVAIIAAGVIGRVFGKAFKEKMQDIVSKAVGLSVLFIGISGTLKEAFTVENGKIESGASLMVICCFVLGSLVGEWIDIEFRLQRFGEWLKVKTRNEKDAGFTDAFLDASFTVCIGAMAVVGSIQDALAGDPSLLYAKSVLDFIIIIVMTSSMGIGAAFSALSVGIFQGTVTLFAKFLEPFLSETALSYMSMTGSMLIFCVGINLIWGRKMKVANMLPTIVFAVLWANIMGEVVELFSR
ncbi:MAG: DUF554 domain-containing protein [Acutalibacteraceae bacterium]